MLKHKTYLEARTELFVEVHWAQIECIAAALLEHERLSAKQIKELLA